MTNLKKTLQILFLSFFVESISFAGAITAEIDRKQSDAGEPFQLTVTVIGSLSGDVEAPILDGFEFQATGHSTSTSIINGTMSTERQIIYTVIAMKTGKFEIPPFKAKLDGKEESTLPISIEIGGTNQAQNQAGSPDIPQNTKVGDKIFIVREIPKKEFYVGEVIPTTIKVYTKVRVAKMSRAGASAQNFRSIPVQGEKQYRESLNNQIYLVNELYELLIPKKAGELKLPTFSVEAAYVAPVQNRRNSPDPFDLFNFFRGAGQTVQAKIDSAEKIIKVLEPPTAGRPNNYADIVGQFKGSAQLSAQKAKVGETITITYSIEGDGALDSMVEPKFDLSKYGKVFVDRPDVQEKLEVGHLRSTRVQKLALVVSSPGNVTLPDLDVGFFDPKEKKYKVINLKLGAIEVEADANAAMPSISEKKREDVVTQTTAPGSEEKKILTSETVKRIAWIGGGFISLLLLIGFVRMGRSKWKDHQLKPTIVARQNEKDAQHILSELQKSKDMEQIFQSLQKYVAKLEPIEASAVTSKDILNAFQKRTAKPESIATIAKVLKAYEKSKYAPASKDSFEQLVEELSRAISEITLT